MGSDDLCCFSDELGTEATGDGEGPTAIVIAWVSFSTSWKERKIIKITKVSASHAKNK